jgi:hypothetical protein
VPANVSSIQLFHFDLGKKVLSTIIKKTW